MIRIGFRHHQTSLLPYNQPNRIIKTTETMSTGQNLDSAYPTGITGDPNPTSGGQPVPSSRQDLPVNNDPLLERADQPDQSSNPVKRSAATAGENNTTPGSSSTGSTAKSDEKKGLGQKIKDKVGI